MPHQPALDDGSVGGRARALAALVATASLAALAARTALSVAPVLVVSFSRAGPGGGD